ncbi:MAG TPA: holo-ACP synthase [Mycobacteriales bacterium]|nr:holo-ACP synthase [Mycobacteriales bacterium]
MIVGIGVDIVDVERFGRTIERTPHLLHRLFTDSERDAPVRSLAATFAAKEAVAKVLGAPPGLVWHDCEVQHEPSGRPRLAVRGTVAASAADSGVLRWHLSLTHDGTSALAMVVGEGLG